ncbi:MAG TPA: COX15/CtaA family protein [Gemmatimonadaceae bacterium]|nr:COX15/CtaA family protein [Gemmatimonadaceae bacterium]
MTALRRLGYIALVLAFGQIVFGAIVRITGSGMGCGDDWPKCAGQWLPPLDRPDLIIEITHRFIALALGVTLLLLLLIAAVKRRSPGVGGRGGVLRALLLALPLMVAAAVLGAVTVFLELPPLVVVAHKLLALMVLAALATAVVRARGFGAGDEALQSWPSTVRSTSVAAAMALLVVLLGAFTANVPGAAPACQGFPLCNGSLIPTGGLALLHMTHRVLAFLLALHVIGINLGVMRRVEPPSIVRGARVALLVVVAQIAIAAALVQLLLPPALQSLHQAVGTLVWLSLFVLAMLARQGVRAAEIDDREPDESSAVVPGLAQAPRGEA